jgi:hypothetical protein
VNEGWKGGSEHVAARGPEKSGRNWKEKDDSKGRRWMWDDGTTAYWVKEIEGPGIPLYQLFMLTEEVPRMLKQRPVKKLKDAFAAAATHWEWLQTDAGMYDYSRMGWKTASAERTAFFHPKDTLHRGLTFEELIDAVHANEPTIDERSVRKVFKEIMRDAARDAEAELKSNMKQIIEEASE